MCEVGCGRLAAAGPSLPSPSALRFIALSGSVRIRLHRTPLLPGLSVTRPIRVTIASLRVWMATSVPIASIGFGGCDLDRARVPAAAAAHLSLRLTGGRPGAVLLFHPGTCTLRREAIDALNRLSHTPGLVVRGVMLGVDSAGASTGRIAAELGIGFPVASDPGARKLRALRHDAIRWPVLVVIRDAQPVGVLGGAALDHLPTVLPQLFGLGPDEGALHEP